MDEFLRGPPSGGSAAAVPTLPPPGAVVAVRIDRGRRPGLKTGPGTLRVLVADNNRDTADSLAMLVQIWGHTVRAAYDGAEALALALADPPDVLLLDVAMPKLDGCELARQVRRQGRFNGTLLVAVTGYADEGHRRQCLDAGFEHVLIKPVLPAAVEELLQREAERIVNGSRPPAAAVQR